MSVHIQFPFTDEINYSFDPAKIEISGGKARLKLQNNPVSFSQDFASSSGFTFDAAKTEFVGGVMRQKDARPSGAALYIPYSADIHGSWGNGVLTGTPTGAPAIVGGKLDLTGNVNKFVSYPSAGNVSNALQQGCIRFRVTPNYSGQPANRQNFFAIGGAGVSSNLTVYHDSSAGYLYISIYNSSGAAIYSSYIQAGLYWNPVAGTEYEFELNYNIDNPNSIRLFINGTLWGVAVSGTGTRSAANLTNLWIGTLRGGIPAVSNNFSIRNILLFDTVQHTSNYTPDWSTVHNTIYVSDMITIPEMEYTGAGALISISDFAATVGGSPRFTIQIGQSGDYLYHNGAAWVVSNNTYAQANSLAEIIANIATVSVGGEVYIQFRIYTDNSNSQSSIDIIDIDAIGQIYPIDNPSIESNSSFRHEGLESFDATITAPGSTAIRYIISKDGTPYYWNGTAWAASDNTYAQSNTAAEIVAHISAFTTAAVNTIPKIFLHSPDGLSTPEIDLLDIGYNYAGETPSDIDLATVWGYTADFIGANVQNAAIKISLDPKTVFYGNRIFTPTKKTVYSNSIGYFEFDIAETASMSDDPYYVIKIGNLTLRKKVPLAVKVALTAL